MVQCNDEGLRIVRVIGNVTECGGEAAGGGGRVREAGYRRRALTEDLEDDALQASRSRQVHIR